MCKTGAPQHHHCGNGQAAAAIGDILAYHFFWENNGCFAVMAGIFSQDALCCGAASP